MLESGIASDASYLEESKDGAEPSTMELSQSLTVSQQAVVEHLKVACDGCGVEPIRGTRYKCSVC